MKPLILAIGLVSLASTSAFAADAIVSEPIPAGFVWTGGYVGLQAGYAWGSSHFDFGPGDYANPDPDGFLGGIYAGYNHQFDNNVVLGIDADIAYAHLEGSEFAFNPAGEQSTAISVAGDVQWTAALRARAGYAMDRFMPYVAGGLAFAHYEVTINGQNISDSATLTGWTIGAGAEYAFTDNLLGRAEYRYSDFGSEAVSTGTVDLSTHDIRLGIAYKF